MLACGPSMSRDIPDAPGVYDCWREGSSTSAGCTKSDGLFMYLARDRDTNVIQKQRIIILIIFYFIILFDLWTYTSIHGGGAD